MSIRKERGNVSDLDFKSPVPCGSLASDDGAITLVDESATTKVLVRAGVGTAVAADLAVPYGQSRLRADGTLVCGSRPEEWTLLAAPGRAAEVASSVPAGGFVTVIDITHGRAMIRISGPALAATMAKICNIDLSDDMVPDGAVFSASVAKVGCDLVRTDRDGAPSLLISCERSFGGYLHAAVADSAAEFGLPVPAEIALH